MNRLNTFVLLLLFVGSIQTVYAQTRSISGTVVDELNVPVIGASIISDQGGIGTITDIDGKFNLNIPAKSKKLTVSFIGYVKQSVDVSSKDVINITLKEDQTLLDEVVVVGYGSQKRANLTGAISAITNEKLASTKNQNVQNMLTGKLPGVRVVQKTSEPGNYNNNFDIRGFGAPLIIVDGASMGMDEFQRMDPGDVESISVLKDASAAIYGVRSSNGVVLIQTKKGNVGKASIEYSVYFGLQNAAEMLQPIDVYPRAVLVNEKYRRDNPTATDLRYSDEDLASMLSGETKTYDWYDKVMRSTAPQQQHNLTMSGGTDKVNYYLNFGYQSQEGLFSSGDMKYSRYNLRSNINVQVLKDLKVGVRLSGSLDDRDRPRTDSWEIFKVLWRTPTSVSFYANDKAPYYQEIHGNDSNPLALINSDVTGYKEDKNKNINASFDAVYDIPFLKGLSAKALFSYDNTFRDNSEFAKQYFLYNFSGSETYDAVPKGNINKLTRSYNNKMRRTWNVSLNYKTILKDAHNIDASLVYEENYQEGYGFSANREIIMPLPYLDLGNSVQEAKGGAPDEYANKGLIGRLGYDYKSRYLFDGSFRYDGSSRFLPSKQWDWFYSVSLAWRISEEKFIKDNFAFVDNLKLRGSYGRLGDDGANLYEFLGGFNYGSNGNYPKAYDLGSGFVPTLSSRATPNPNIGWLDINTVNLGIDVDLWKGLLGVTFEVFQRTREGLYAKRSVTLPDTFGADMPQENLNSDRTKGFEVELRHRNTVGDLRYEMTGNFSITRGMALDNVHTPYKNSYDEWLNTKTDRYGNVWFLYGDGGRLQSYEQRATFPYLIDQYLLPGDYIREDWNNDGVIDDMDKHPLALKGDDKGNSRPLANFAFSMNMAYKGFDLDLMFQGAALGYIVFGEQLSAPLMWEGNALPHFLDRWRPVDPKANPRDPSNKWIKGEYQYGSRGTDGDSMFGVQNGAYLRLKTATLGYTVPKSIVSKAGIQNLRFYVNGYNLFTITGVKAMDPERPNDQSGSVYPINRTFNFGAQIKF